MLTSEEERGEMVNAFKRRSQVGGRELKRVGRGTSEELVLAGFLVPLLSKQCLRTTFRTSP